jgi:acetylornithine deacetylase/succinyl-diaminopimelate desuccinylase family protein
MIAQIMNSIDKDKKELIKFTQKLVQTPSTNPYLPNESWKINEPIERQVAESIYDKLKEFGFSPKFVSALSNRPNVICKLKRRGKPTLIFNGHMDTVVANEKNWKFNPFSGKIVGNRLFGRGAYDMKVSLACMVFALKAIADLDFPGNVIFTAVVDEEPGACSEIGTKYLLKKGLKVDACIVGEPKTKIIIGQKGGYRFKLIVKGKAVHTGSSKWEKRTKGVNAITKAAKVALSLEKLKIRGKTSPPMFRGMKTVITPTIIRGGSAINIVPDECELFVDVRLMPGVTKRKIKGEIQKLVKKLNARIEELLFVPSAFTNPSEKIVEILKKNAEFILKRKVEIGVTGGWSDAHFFIKRGVPTICGFGPDGENLHAPNEFVYINSMIQVAKIYAITAYEFCGGTL